MKHPRIWLLVILSVLGAALLACSFSAASTSTPAAQPPTSTPFPTATPLGPGLYLEILPDGSTKMIDLQGSYQAILPPKWIGLTVSQSDLENIAHFPSMLNSAYLESFQTISQVGVCNLRMIFADTDPLHYTDQELLALLGVCVDTDEAMFANPLDAVIQTEAGYLPALMPGATTATSMSTTTTGMPVGFIEANWTTQGVKSFEKIAIFKADQETVGFFLVTSYEDRGVWEPILDQVLGTVVLLNP